MIFKKTCPTASPEWGAVVLRPPRDQNWIGGSPSGLQGWTPCGLSWSWAAASAPRRWTCVSWGRTFPVRARWTEPGRPGRAHNSGVPGWTRGRWGWGCLGLKAALQHNNNRSGVNTERPRAQRLQLFIQHKQTIKDTRHHHVTSRWRPHVRC